MEWKATLVVQLHDKPYEVIKAKEWTKTCAVICLRFIWFCIWEALIANQLPQWSSQDIRSKGKLTVKRIGWVLEAA